MNAEDDLLARELGKVGAMGAELGGKVSKVPHAGEVAGAGANLGARLAARFLPTEQSQVTLNLRSAPQAALVRVHAILASQGRLIDPVELRQSPHPILAALVKSGFLNMNPAVIYVEVIAAEADNCTLLLTGAAKEGLIKQHSAKKAVDRLAAALHL